MATGTGSGLPADEPDSAIGHSVESPPQDGEESTLQQHGGVQASGSTPPAVLIGGVVKTFGGLGSSEGSASASTEQTKTKSKSQQSELVTGHEGAIVKQSEAQSESTSDGTGLEQARQGIAATARELRRKDDRIKDLEHQLKLRTLEASELRRRLSEATEKTRQLEKRLEREKELVEEQKNAEINTLKAELKQKEDTIEKMKKEKASMEKENQERIREYEDEIQALKQQIRETKQERSKKVCLLSQDIARLEKEVMEHKLTEKTLEAKLSEANEKAAEYRVELLEIRHKEEQDKRILEEEKRKEAEAKHNEAEEKRKEAEAKHNEEKAKLEEQLHKLEQQLSLNSQTSEDSSTDPSSG